MGAAVRLLPAAFGDHLSVLFRSYREADEHRERTVENLKGVITGQASILACFAFTGGYDDAVITSAALRAINIGFPHQTAFPYSSGWSGSSAKSSASACRSSARAVSEAASSGSAVALASFNNNFACRSRLDLLTT